MTRMAAADFAIYLLCAAVTSTVVAAEQDNTTVPESTSRRYEIGYQETARFGGPNSPAGQLERDDTVREPAFDFPAIYEFTEPWRNWKRERLETNGLQIAGHYTTLYQRLSDSIDGEDKASSGVFRGIAKWTLTGRDTANTGSLNAMVDYRHAFRDLAPSELATEAGYSGVTGTLYSDVDWVVVNLNWEQVLANGYGGVLVGRHDPNDYMNVHGFVNPWETFSNLSILLDSSVAFPDAGWGAIGGWRFTEQWYFALGFNDANGKVDDDLDWFDGGAEFFSWVEIGLSPSQAERWQRKFNVSLWHVDERDDAGIDSGNGVLVSGHWTFANRFGPFLKLGLSDGAEQVVIYEKSVTLGFTWEIAPDADEIGFAVNWGEPPAKDLSDQTTLEAYYRFQFAQNFAITPSLQLLIDPALNPDDDEVWVFGLRMRLTF
ncbi:carbohydrate porin [Gammaproteobacteria bacterium]|nr:carbohydrate porin [Gammaproteobacteria bacterium]